MSNIYNEGGKVALMGGLLWNYNRRRKMMAQQHTFTFIGFEKNCSDSIINSTACIKKTGTNKNIPLLIGDCVSNLDTVYANGTGYDNIVLRSDDCSICIRIKVDGVIQFTKMGKTSKIIEFKRGSATSFSASYNASYTLIDIVDTLLTPNIPGPVIYEIFSSTIDTTTIKSVGNDIDDSFNCLFSGLRFVATDKPCTILVTPEMLLSIDRLNYNDYIKTIQPKSNKSIQLIQPKVIICNKTIPTGRLSLEDVSFLIATILYIKIITNNMSSGIINNFASLLSDIIIQLIKDTAETINFNITNLLNEFIGSVKAAATLHSINTEQNFFDHLISTTSSIDINEWNDVLTTLNNNKSSLSTLLTTVIQHRESYLFNNGYQLGINPPSSPQILPKDFAKGFVYEVNKWLYLYGLNGHNILIPYSLSQSIIVESIIDFYTNINEDDETFFEHSIKVLENCVFSTNELDVLSTNLQNTFGRYGNCDYQVDPDSTS
jgi:hypothetical protein